MTRKPVTSAATSSGQAAKPATDGKQAPQSYAPVSLAGGHAAWLATGRDGRLTIGIGVRPDPSPAKPSSSLRRAV
jgi:hypothetical protein